MLPSFARPSLPSIRWAGQILDYLTVIAEQFWSMLLMFTGCITYHLLMRLGLVGLTLIASSHFLQALGQNMFRQRNKQSPNLCDT